MPDREKVIMALKMLTTRVKKGAGTVIKISCNEEFISILFGAVELLKEQEAVEPILIREGRNKHYNDYVCPRCDNEVVYEQNYCSECGIPFLWKGGEQDA